MSWTRGLPAALAVCVLVVAGSVGCGTGRAEERTDGGTPAPVGRVLEDRDEDGRPYRQVDEEYAPEVGIEVQPDREGDGWRVRLSLRGFRLSPAGAPQKAVAGRGTVRLHVDGRFVTELRTPEYRLPGRLVPRGTHHVTARLHADDGTVWSVDGEPVEATADITVSEAEVSRGAAPGGGATGSGGGGRDAATSDGAGD
ncbi:hypothetical protein [Streptomyces sp. JB150]|uniref:hypothetical protein n=1 Tax=Streptomyces sp. JB150 TaxID=2714844 RepID=UPI00140844D7|nr:hypothetical protein [Streptomyces sp. JB150]QIJ61808.1 hypothetical protein G7Z13_06985 [Streptomyces sp. JB150]